MAVRVNGTLYFLHTDHLGSTTLLTDQSQQVVARLGYRPYGDTRYAMGALPTDRRYTGQRWESFGLYDYRARYYSPSLGRFVSPDAIVPDPGSPYLLNRYAYSKNNPLLYSDPSGHCPLCVALGLIAVAFLSTGCNAEIQQTSTPRGGGHYEVHFYPSEIQVKADIQIYGEGASPEIAQRYEQAIESIWNYGENGTRPTHQGIPVVFDVNVFYKEPSNGWKRNLIGEPVRPQRGEGDALNMIFVEPGYVPIGLHPYLAANDGSYDWDWGVWWAEMNDTLIAHEAGHIFGLPDYYNYETGKPVDSAHLDWIMANPNGWIKPGKGEVEEIINTAKYRFYHYGR